MSVSQAECLKSIDHCWSTDRLEKYVVAKDAGGHDMHSQRVVKRSCRHCGRVEELQMELREVPA